VDVRRCPDAEANCTDSPECPESTSGCRGTVNYNWVGLASRLEDEADGSSSLGCYDDLAGTFCLLCAPHPEGKRVYYAAATAARRAQCLECHETARDSILAFFGVALLLITIVLFSYAGCVTCLSNQRKWQLQYAWRVFTPQNKLKILVSVYMITTKVDSVYEVRAAPRRSRRSSVPRPLRTDAPRCTRLPHTGGQVEMPPAVKRLLSLFASLISFGFNSVSSVLECLGMRGYVSTLAFYAAAPMILAVIVLLVALGRMLYTRRFTAEVLLETAAPALLKLAFLAYPLVATVAFSKSLALERSQRRPPRHCAPRLSALHHRRLSTQTLSRATHSPTANGSRPM
jgi:hypothetical protein